MYEKLNALSLSVKQFHLCFDFVVTDIFSK